MPCPWSVTRNSTALGVCVRWTSTTPPLAENFTALSTRFHTTCWKRDGSHQIVSTSRSRSALIVTPLSLDKPCRLASAAATASAGLSRCRSSSSLPAVMRETSSRSEIRRACTHALRSIALTRLSASGSLAMSGERWSSREKPTMALSGVRSSCESAARKSSLSRLASSASRAREAFEREQPLPLRFRRDPLRDVADDGEAGVADAVARHVPFEFDVAAAGAEQRRGATPPSRLVERRGDLRDVDLPIVGTEDRQVPADDGIALALEHLRHRRVDVEEDEVLGQQRDAVHRAVEHRLEPGFALLDGILGAARAQQRPYRADQHRRFDRVRQVAIGAGIHAQDLVGIVDEGRREVRDRRPPRLRPGAQLPADLEAVDVRQVDVQDDQIGPLALGGVQRLVAAGRRHHAVPHRLRGRDWWRSGSPRCRRRRAPRPRDYRTSLPA